MQKTPFETPLRQCLRMQVEGLGRVFAKYQVDEEAIWEALEELDRPYQRLRRALAHAVFPDAPRRWTPHPAIRQMMRKLDREPGE